METVCQGHHVTSWWQGKDQGRETDPLMWPFKRISSIRRFLTEDAVKILVTSYIFSRLDYCNCLLMGNSVIQPLQKLQNFAAPRHHHSTPLLEKLHWLPISERIKYKVSCMCFSAINGSGPAYLWTAACLHSVSYATLFFWDPHAGNPSIQTQDSWLSHLLLLWTPHLEFTPTRP